MPAKNTANFLQECLDSIIGQTYGNWELIAVDDHSTDSTQQILKDYSRRFGNIKIYHNQGQGIIHALRLAYQNSCGEYVTRMDSDDIMTPRKIELMVNVLQQKGPGHVAIGLVKYFHEEKLGNGYQQYEEWLNDHTTQESNFDDIYKECSIPSPCWMMAREDLERIGGFDSDVYPEDYDLAFRMKKHGIKVASVHHLLHHWRDYPTRTSRTNQNYSDNRFSSLKVSYLLDIDRDEDKTLCIWGAGHRGKRIAQLLVDRKVAFIWISNNTKKIGQNIYGVIIQDQEMVLARPAAMQVVIAISALAEKEAISTLSDQFHQHQYFRFS